jgi:predicted peptidase
MNKAASWMRTALVCLFVSVPRWAPAQAGATATNEFLARIYTNETKQTLPYRLLLPRHYDPNRSYPVILFLHGAAARGADNAEPLNWGPLLFLDDTLRTKHDFFLVVPQCPRDGAWLELGRSGAGAFQLSQHLSLALALVRQQLPKEFNLDPARRYLTGVSMGGHAVWVILEGQPGQFAAAVPVCSGGDVTAVTREASKCPVWAFHSEDDHLVPVQQARNLVKAWREHGGTARYTEYTGLKHSSWKKAYTEGALFDWLFQQRLP